MIKKIEKICISILVLFVVISETNCNAGAKRTLMADNLTTDTFEPFNIDDLKGDSIVVLQNENYQIPLDRNDKGRLALLILSSNNDSVLVSSIKKLHPVDVYNFSFASSFSDAGMLAEGLSKRYDRIIMHIDSALSATAKSLVLQLQAEMRTITLVSGNKELLKELKYSPSLVYAPDNSDQTLSGLGKFLFTGNQDLINANNFRIKLDYFDSSSSDGINRSNLYKIDSIAEDGIRRGAYPAVQILAMKGGKIFYQKAFGTLSVSNPTPVDVNTIFDMASCTKIFATTLACMKLYDEGKLSLDSTLGTYLPWLRNTDKAGLTIKNIMLHQAGLEPDFPIGSLLLKGQNLPNPDIFHTIRDSAYSVRVAQNIYTKKGIQDSLNNEIRDGKLGPAKYVYSDIDFQLMGYIVEQITGMPLDQYVKRTFYDKMGLVNTGFNPRERYNLNDLTYTECEKEFRLQCLHGDVHDPRAALFGGVAGHAGLFSNTYDLAVLSSMLLNNGTINGVQWLKPSTIQLFTSYQSNISRRGIGFDKPTKASERTPQKYQYPSNLASPETYGHTGYTGTCVWIDPKYDFVYIFLSNRVNPTASSILYNLDIRPKIQDALYNAIGVH